MRLPIRVEDGLRLKLATGVQEAEVLKMSEGRMRIGEMLLAENVITRDQLDEALKVQERDGGRLGVILVKLGFVESKVLADYLARQTSATISRLKSDRSDG